MGRLLLGFLGLAFFLIGGGVMLWIGKPTLDTAKASKSWPSVDGVVIESRVETKKSNDRKDGPTYKAVVVYKYEVGGEEFSSDRIWFGGEVSTSKRTQMRDIVKGYPEGQPTEVHYDPENPAEAVLQPGVFFTSYFMIIFGAVFAVPGGIMLLVAAFVMKSKPTAAADPFGRHPESSHDAEDDLDDDDFHDRQEDDFDSGWSDSGDDD